MRLSIQHKAQIFLCCKIGHKIQFYSSETDPNNFLIKSLESKQYKNILSNKNFRELVYKDYKDIKDKAIKNRKLGITKKFQTTGEEFKNDYDRISIDSYNSDTSIYENENDRVNQNVKEYSKLMEAFANIFPDSDIPLDIMKRIDMKFEGIINILLYLDSTNNKKIKKLEEKNEKTKERTISSSKKLFVIDKIKISNKDKGKIKIEQSLDKNINKFNEKNLPPLFNKNEFIFNKRLPSDSLTKTNFQMSDSSFNNLINQQTRCTNTYLGIINHGKNLNTVNNQLLLEDSYKQMEETFQTFVDTMTNVEAQNNKKISAFDNTMYGNNFNTPGTNIPLINLPICSPIRIQK